MRRRVLPLHNMSDRHYGLTASIAESYTEAARVCLDRHHEPPTDFEIVNPNEVASVIAEWHKTDERTRRAWANMTVATEAGAYACALAAVEVTKGLVAVHRAETRTGADYYIAPMGTAPDDLEKCGRLEVSGVDRGAKQVVSQRLREKIDQTREGASNLPAMAGVVGFQARVISLFGVEES